MLRTCTFTSRHKNDLAVVYAWWNQFLQKVKNKFPYLIHPHSFKSWNAGYLNNSFIKLHKSGRFLFLNFSNQNSLNIGITPPQKKFNYKGHTHNTELTFSVLLISSSYDIVA